MRNGHTYRVCPNCGAAETADRATCSQCGQLTVQKSHFGHREQEAGAGQPLVSPAGGALTEREGSRAE